MPDPTNPFQTPQASMVSVNPNAEAKPDQVGPIPVGLWMRWRISLWIFLVPVLLNYLAFDLTAIMASEYSTFMKTIFRVVNLGSLCVGFLLLWAYGLTVAEFVVEAVRSILFRYVSRSDWMRAFRDSVYLLMYFSFCGALIWCAWLYFFYYAGEDFLAVSFPAAVFGHALAAGWYLPLLWRWFKLA